MNEGLLYYLMETITVTTPIEGGGSYTSTQFVHDWQVFLYWGIFLACLVVSYLLGSVNSAVIVSRIFHGEDIRNFGSGNAGLTNIMRTYGKKEAGLTLFGDMAKMGLSIFLTGSLFGFAYVFGMSFNFLLYLSGLVCMIGHIKPIFYGFKGGKGVLCYATMGLILAPLPFLFILACFFLIVALTKYISLGSIVCAAFFPIALQGYMQMILDNGRFDGLIFLASLAASVILILCHRANISRLLNHTENKFSFKKKDKKPVAEAELTEITPKEGDASDGDK